MTSILIVGNKVSEGPMIGARIDLVEDIIGSYPAESVTIGYDDLKGIPEGIDAVILTGSRMNVSDGSTKKRIDHVVGLIRNTDLPVLGICFGFHLIMHAFGCDVRRNEASGESKEPDGTFIDLEITDDLGVVGKGHHPVNADHKDYVEPTDPALEGVFQVHGTSVDGILSYLQYASHMYRPIHAFQFHPECFEGAPMNAKETGIEFLHGFLYHTLKE